MTFLIKKWALQVSTIKTCEEAKLMITTFQKSAISLTLPICALFPAQLMAGLLTVNTATDPETVDSSNCTTATQACSFREALAAADETPGHDSIIFDVDEPIYITRKLTANSPVSIDGNRDTLIRVHQGYNIAVLPDFRRDFDPVPTLQPTYYSENGHERYMLELLADGSEVKNLTMDGGITPNEGEGPLARIDFDSDGDTDFFLSTINSDGETVWLVGGGIGANFADSDQIECPNEPTPGSVNISDNVLRNMGNTAVYVNFHYNTVIAGNDISGGGVGQRGVGSDGIFLYCGSGAEVTGNTVSEYRTGVALSEAAAVTINRNQTMGNSNGVELAGAYAFLGPNFIEDNYIADNYDYGMVAYRVMGTSIRWNHLERNGTHPEEHGGIWINSSEGNSIHENDSLSNSSFGILVEDSRLNEVTNNRTQKNGLGGIILVNGSSENLVERNNTKLNFVGIISSISYEGAAVPTYNLFNKNQIRSNTLYDVLDVDPLCRNTWTANQFKTVYSAAENCID